MKKEDKVKLSHTFLWSIEQIKDYKLIFSINLFLGFVVTAINIIVVQLIQMAISKATGERDAFVQVVIFLISILFLGLWVNMLQKYIGGKLRTKVTYNLKSLFNKKMVSLSKSSKDALNSGDVMSRFNHDINTVTGFVPEGLYNIIFQIIMALTAAIYMIFINWLLLIISIAFVPVAMFILNVLQKKMGDYFMQDSEYRGKSNIVANETIKNVYLTKSYNLQNVMSDKIRVFYQGCLDSWIKIHKIFSPILMITIMLQHLPKFICICFGGWLALNGQLKLENLVGFILLLGYVVSPIIAIPQIIVTMSSSGRSIKRLESILDLSDARTNGDDLDRFENNSILIEAKNVTFGYNKNKVVLKNIKFKLRQGEQIALVGKSGSGKSSIIRLITGDYEVDSGSLLLYGQPYNLLSLKSIRNKVALVSQDITIFPLSISENIAIGSADKNISQEKIEEAAKLANAHQFIMKLPDKYETILDENGINLSGGERQMLSIARAFLKNASIILLDEPTSALDAQAEKIIKESLKRLVQNKGVIIISHRLSSIINSSKILVIKDGCIIDEGHHGELLERNDYYKNLYLHEFTKDRNEVSV